MKLRTDKLLHYNQVNRLSVLSNAQWKMIVFFFALSIFHETDLLNHVLADDSPLPKVTKEELSEKIRQSRLKYNEGYLEVLYRDQRDTNAFGQGKPVMVDFHGDFVYAKRGQKWKGEFNGKTYRTGTSELHPRGWTAGHDGKLHYSWERPNGGFIIGEQQAHENIPTPIFFWSSHGAGFADSLLKNNWKYQKEVTVEGFRCYRLTLSRLNGTRLQRQELTVSPRQSYLPVNYRVFNNFKLSWSHVLSRLRQTEKGLWYPERVVKNDTFMKQKYDARVRRFDPAYRFNENYFHMQIPWGVHVRDNRSGHIYLNDPWWPELKNLLRERFDWPPVDLTPLRDANSYAEEKVDGRKAPELQVAEWLKGTPQTLTSRKGRVTLLHFSTGSLWSPNPSQVAALKELHKIFKPSGLEIIGIVTGNSDVLETKRNLDELGVTWSVALDSKSTKKSSYGKTFDAYGLKAYISPVLVDHSGKIRLINDGALASDIKQMLEAAGAEKVPETSLDFFDRPNALPQAVRVAWTKWVNDAPKNAAIHGTITNEGSPIVGVDVSAKLRLEISGSANTTSATSVFPWRQPAVMNTSRKDGAFDLAGLCKGTYLLTLNIPGKDPIEKRIHLPTNESSLRLEIKLEDEEL